jgi:hypothetical protein
MKLDWETYHFHLRDFLELLMNKTRTATAIPSNVMPSGYLLLGTGLAFASLILVPAVATSIGLGPSLTGALRMALMKASSRAAGRSRKATAAAAGTRCSAGARPAQTGLPEAQASAMLEGRPPHTAL